MSGTEQEPGEEGDGPAAPAGPVGAAPQVSLRRALAFRRTRTQLLVGSLFCLLGFAAAVQVGTTRGGVDLGRADESDLVRILDDVNQREARLQGELRDLEVLQDRLRSGNDADTVAVEQSRERLATLSILAGTAPAEGPGVIVQIADPQQAVDATIMLDAVQELRDAGAEAIQVGDQRVVAATWFGDPPRAADGVLVNGQAVAPPYEIRAIGDPRTLSAALRIPGGVVDTVRTVGGDVSIGEHQQLQVDALLPAPSPQYARPATP